MIVTSPSQTLSGSPFLNPNRGLGEPATGLAIAAAITKAVAVAMAAAKWATSSYDSWMAEKLQTVIDKIPLATRAGSPLAKLSPIGGFFRMSMDGKTVVDATTDFYKKMYAQVSAHYDELLDEIDGDLCAKEPWYNPVCAYASKESAGWRMANRFGSYASTSGLPKYQQHMLRYYIFSRFQNATQAKSEYGKAEAIKASFVNEQQALFAKWQQQELDRMNALTGDDTDKEMPNWLPFAIAGGVALVAALVMRKKK